MGKAGTLRLPFTGRRNPARTEPRPGGESRIGVSVYWRVGVPLSPHLSDLGGSGVRSYDLPAVVKLLKVHRGVSHHLLLGTREIDRPPGEGECEIRFQ